MKTISLIILSGFLALSLFGFLGMLELTDMAHAPNTCLASLAQRGACPPPEHTVESALFHTSAFKVFSTTMLSGAVLLLACALFTGLVTPLSAVALLGLRTVAETLREVVLRYQALRRFRFALARLEHSPTSR